MRRCMLLEGVLLLGLAALLAGCAGGRLGGQTPQEKREAVRQAQERKRDRFAPIRLRQENLRSTLSDERGRPIWEAAARFVEIDEPSKTGRLEGARFVFYENGKAALEARAPLVTANYEKRTVRLSGGVEGVSRAGGYGFRAQQAEWGYEKKQVRATGDVTLWRAEWRAVGDELVGDTALSKVRLTGNPARLMVTETSKRTR